MGRDGHWLRGGLARRSGAVDVVRAVQSYRQQISSCELCVGDSRNFVTKLCVELLELLEIGRVTRELEFWNSHFFLGFSTGEVEGERKEEQKRSKRTAHHSILPPRAHWLTSTSPSPTPITAVGVSGEPHLRFELHYLRICHRDNWLCGSWM